MRYLWNLRCFSRWTGFLVFDLPGDNPMTPQCSHPDDSHVYAAENSGSLPYMEEVYPQVAGIDRKSTRLNSSHGYISYAVFCLKKKTNHILRQDSSQYNS